MSLVIDASVALRWYVQALDSPSAITLLELDEPLIAPDLVVAEVANAAWKLARVGEISWDHGASIATAVPAAFSALVGAASLAPRAFLLAQELDHPVYDCLYLALAEAEASHVVTADRRLLGRVDDTVWRGLAAPLSAY